LEIKWIFSNLTEPIIMTYCVVYVKKFIWFEPEFSRLKFMPCHLRKTSRQICIKPKGAGGNFHHREHICLPNVLFCYFHKAWRWFLPDLKISTLSPPLSEDGKKYKSSIILHIFLICYMIVYICIKICALKADRKNILYWQPNIFT